MVKLRTVFNVLNEGSRGDLVFAELNSFKEYLEIGIIRLRIDNVAAKTKTKGVCRDQTSSLVKRKIPVPVWFHGFSNKEDCHHEQCSFCGGHFEGYIKGAINGK